MYVFIIIPTCIFANEIVCLVSVVFALCREEPETRAACKASKTVDYTIRDIQEFLRIPDIRQLVK